MKFNLSESRNVKLKSSNQKTKVANRDASKTLEGSREHYFGGILSLFPQMLLFINT